MNTIRRDVHVDQTDNHVTIWVHRFKDGQRIKHLGKYEAIGRDAKNRPAHYARRVKRGLFLLGRSLQREVERSKS